jgi:hypothetical protein
MRCQTLTKPVIDVVIPKTIIFIMLHNMFRLMPINGHNMNKRAAEIKCNLTGGRGGL